MELPDNFYLRLFVRRLWWLLWNASLEGVTYNADTAFICSDPLPTFSSVSQGSCQIEGCSLHLAGGSRWPGLRQDAWSKLGKSHVFLVAHTGSVNIYLSKMIWRRQVVLRRSKGRSMLSSQDLILQIRFWCGRKPWKKSTLLKWQHESLMLNHLISSYILTSYLSLLTSTFPSSFLLFTL